MFLNRGALYALAFFDVLMLAIHNIKGLWSYSGEITLGVGFFYGLSLFIEATLLCEIPYRYFRPLGEPEKF